MVRAFISCNWIKNRHFKPTAVNLHSFLLNISEKHCRVLSLCFIRYLLVLISNGIIELIWHNSMAASTLLWRYLLNGFLHEAIVFIELNLLLPLERSTLALLFRQLLFFLFMIKLIGLPLVTNDSGRARF